jgi:hypothetical protein
MRQETFEVPGFHTLGGESQGLIHGGAVQMSDGIAGAMAAAGSCCTTANGVPRQPRNPCRPLR